ncbi:MAG: LacI family DNA-binding transcriptional regulator [Eubacteriales bacterium]|nr:LacI family DNA-binding transcriptional regulator [Eubacteriales bacterium]
MVRLKEIADECGVSATTVSNILNGKARASEETRQRVLEVVRRRGYQPNYIAQGLRNQKTRMIGIIAEDIVQFTTPPVIESIMEHCEKRGYRTIMQNLRLYARWSDRWFHDEEAYRSVLLPALQELNSIRVDGVICVAGHERVIRFQKGDLSVPLVMAYSYAEGIPAVSVVIDEERGGYEMMRYLLSMGHRRIGIIAGREDNIHAVKRLVGIQKAMFEAQVPYNPGWVRYGNWDRESGYRLAKELLQEDITAILAMTDTMAGGVYDCMEELGLRAGQDIAVTGYNNTELSEYVHPRLTTMTLPLSEIGYRSAETLLNQLEAGEETGSGEEQTETDRAQKDWTGGKEILIPGSLVIRNSVHRMESQAGGT